MRTISRFSIVFFLLTLFFACKSKTDTIKNYVDTIENDVVKEKRDAAAAKTDLKETDSSEKEEEKELEFLDFTYAFNFEKTKLSDSGLYSVNYDLVFVFDNKDDKFTVSYDIFDEDNVKILSKSDVKPIFDRKKNLYSVSDSFF
ncbi:MAG TPA: hypothetical protein PKK13_11670, partial [Spirochaetota bacterium]|nr:hypothetical protein [Spirochaetota bacterium]